MDFKEKLQQAKAGGMEKRFDEDLYQELSKTLLNCIDKFCIN